LGKLFHEYFTAIYFLMISAYDILIEWGDKVANMMIITKVNNHQLFICRLLIVFLAVLLAIVGLEL